MRVPRPWIGLLPGLLGVYACAAPPPPRAEQAKPVIASSAPARSSVRAPSRPGFDPREYYSRKALYVLKGDASYYGKGFAGRPTANGEIFDPGEYTAAHRSLPFGTIVRVTRRSTGDWVLVRINDRGPFGKRERILDLSEQAARRLDMLHAGVVKVNVEVLELGPGR